MATHFGWNYIRKISKKINKLHTQPREINVYFVGKFTHARSPEIDRLFALVCAFVCLYSPEDLLTMLCDLFNKLISFALNCRL